MEGGCYCGAVRYRADGGPLFKGQCFCRECQHVAGGSANIVMGMQDGSFAYTKGTPRSFQRSDLENPVSREFCGDCGTHLLARAATVPGAVLLKVGTLDDPSLFGGPQMVIFTSEMQSFHQLPDGAKAFERGPS